MLSRSISASIRLDLCIDVVEHTFRRIALDLRAPLLVPEVAVGGTHDQPFRPLGDPMLTELLLVGAVELGDDRLQRLERVEALAHLADRLVDGAVGLDQFAQLPDPHVVLLEDVVAHELIGGLVVVERHRVDDRLLQRVGVLLAGGAVRQQVPHIFAHVVESAIAIVDEIRLADRLDHPRARIIPFGRKAAFRSRLDEILGGEDAADRDEAGEHGLVALGLAGFDRHADGDRRTLAVGVLEAERDIGAGLIAPPLVLAEGAKAVIGH